MLVEFSQILVVFPVGIKEDTCTIKTIKFKVIVMIIAQNPKTKNKEKCRELGMFGYAFLNELSDSLGSNNRFYICFILAYKNWLYKRIKLHILYLPLLWANFRGFLLQFNKHLSHFHNNVFLEILFTDFLQLQTTNYTPTLPSTSYFITAIYSILIIDDII